MRSSVAVAVMLFMLAASSALWIGKSLAQSATVTSPGGASATSSGAQNTQGGSASTVHVFETVDDFSPEVDLLRKTDREHTQVTRALLAKYQKSDDSQERESLREQLNKVVTEQFETRQQIRARELEELEAQLGRLRALHDRRKKEKDQIVRDWLQKLLRDAEGLGWGTEDASNLGGSGTTRRSVSSPPQNYPSRGSRSVQ